MITITEIHKYQNDTGGLISKEKVRILIEDERYLEVERAKIENAENVHVYFLYKKI